METIEASQKNPTKVRFIHKKSEDYKKYYTNGAFGAISGRGDFEFNLFYEHTDVPEEQIMNYEDGQFKPTEENPTDPTDVIVIRDFKVGVIMTLEQAEAIGKWLVNTVEEFKKNQEKRI